jgi:hypothetical protein
MFVLSYIYTYVTSLSSRKTNHSRCDGGVMWQEQDFLEQKTRLEEEIIKRGN